MAATVGAEDIETVLLEMAETSPAVHDKHIQAQHKGLHMETRSNLGKNHSRLSTQLKVALAVIIVTLIAIIVFLGIREGTGLLSAERKPGGNDGTHSWIPNESGEFNNCGIVPVIGNGAVTLNDPPNSTYGSSATVLCETGYETLVPKILCESNGSWTNTSCFLKDCNDPTPDHGTVDTTSGFKVTSLALVTCDIGYKVSGSRIITCQFGGTWTVNSTCAPIECGNLTIAQGVFEAANGTTYLQTATVTCNSGYTLTGDATIVCEDNGRWSGTPSCDPSDCKDPTPVHGVSSFTMTTYGGQANITCNEGYDIKGLPSITCLDNATWSDSTVCIARDCGTLAISNGNVVLASGTTTYTSLALVSCRTGYVIQGTAFVLCQSNGSWSDSPSCEPVDCRDPTPNHGFTDNNTTTFGTTVTVTCLPGYDISGNSSITCLSSGFWSSYPACLAKDCGDPTPNNGKAVASLGTTFPNNATIFCSFGYNLVGSVSISCQSNGTWSDSPYCYLKALGDSCLVKRDCTEFDDYSVCDTGHTNTCVCANGYINTSNVCTIVDCGMPSLPNGLSTSPLGTTYGEITIVSCDTGFTLNGSAYITCLSNGTWSTTPTCNIVDCGDPTPSNASSNFTSGTKYQSLANIKCDAGYAISGSSNIICQKDGQWSSYPTCKPVDCGNPAPLNGYTGSSGTSFRDNVTIFCEPGYTLNGSNSITCQMNGTWSDRPVCNIKDCGDPSPSNGSAVAPRGTAYGQSALITCDTGFTANGSVFVTCLANGTWSSLPTCQLKETNGGWSVWAGWTDCSATCNTGVQTRQRQCNNPVPSSEGQYCEGRPVDVIHCNNQQCPQTNGGWSVWADWNVCSATCDTGVQSRQRQCNNPVPSSGGQYCQGSQMDVVLCNKQQCPQTNGGWSVWSVWTDCSATCNTGVRTRQRQCNNPVPSSGGQYCQGSQMDVVHCNKQQCPQRKVAFVAQHSTSANEYGQNQKVIFATVNYNNGGGYDSKTGIFTAPEPGTYMFSFYILSLPNTSAHVSLVVEGRHRGEADASGYTSAGNSDVVYLDKGMQVWIQTNRIKSKYYISAYKSQFMGVLLD